VATFELQNGWPHKRGTTVQQQKMNSTLGSIDNPIIVDRDDNELGSFSNPIIIDDSDSDSDITTITFDDISDDEESSDDKDPFSNPIIIDDSDSDSDITTITVDDISDDEESSDDKDPSTDRSIGRNMDGYNGGVSGTYTPCSFDSDDEYIIPSDSNDDIPGKFFSC